MLSIIMAVVIGYLVVVAILTVLSWILKNF